MSTDTGSTVVVVQYQCHFIPVLELIWSWLWCNRFLTYPNLGVKVDWNSCQYHASFMYTLCQSSLGVVLVTCNHHILSFPLSLFFLKHLNNCALQCVLCMFQSKGILQQNSITLTPPFFAFFCFFFFFWSEEWKPVTYMLVLCQPKKKKKRLKFWWNLVEQLWFGHEKIKYSTVNTSFQALCVFR